MACLLLHSLLSLCPLRSPDHLLQAFWLPLPAPRTFWSAGDCPGWRSAVGVICVWKCVAPMKSLPFSLQSLNKAVLNVESILGNTKRSSDAWSLYAGLIYMRYWFCSNVIKAQEVLCCKRFAVPPSTAVPTYLKESGRHQTKARASGVLLPQAKASWSALSV